MRSGSRSKVGESTVSAKKLQICRLTVIIVGQKCSIEGRSPEDAKIEKILTWPPLQTVKEFCGFLRLCGTVKIWIKGYSEITRSLTELVWKDVEFVWDFKLHHVPADKY